MKNILTFIHQKLLDGYKYETKKKFLQLDPIFNTNHFRRRYVLLLCVLEEKQTGSLKRNAALFSVKTFGSCLDRSKSRHLLSQNQSQCVESQFHPLSFRLHFPNRLSHNQLPPDGAAAAGRCCWLLLQQISYTLFCGDSS